MREHSALKIGFSKTYSRVIAMAVKFVLKSRRLGKMGNLSYIGFFRAERKLIILGKPVLADIFNCPDNNFLYQK